MPYFQQKSIFKNKNEMQNILFKFKKYTWS